jgi:hypothetical protein
MEASKLVFDFSKGDIPVGLYKMYTGPGRLSPGSSSKLELACRLLITYPGDTC